MNIKQATFIAVTGMAAGTAVPAPLINEFQPNPDGADPATTTIELLGSPNTGYSGFLSSIETDGTSGRGIIDRQTFVSGTFDANGLATVSVDDLENPSFTLVFSSDDPGDIAADLDADNDGFFDDTSIFGTVFDAIGVVDSVPDLTAFAAQLGGVQIAFTGAEPELVFRDGVTKLVYALNDNITPSTLAYAADGQAVDLASFDFSPTPDTFGRLNPTLIAVPLPGTFFLALLGMAGLAATRRTQPA